MAEPVIRFRVDAQIKKSFEEACKSNDITASQVLRKFIKEYIKKNGQKNLF